MLPGQLPDEATKNPEWMNDILHALLFAIKFRERGAVREIERDDKFLLHFPSLFFVGRRFFNKRNQHIFNSFQLTNFN